MSVDVFRERLVLLIDGDLGKDERVEVEAHIKKCKACAAELERLKKTLLLTKYDEAPDFKPVEWTEHSPGVLIPTRWIKKGIRWAWIGLPAAALVFAVIFGGDVKKVLPETGMDALVVVGSDSLSESEGQELAALLLSQDENFKKDLLAYEEQSPRSIYSYVGELGEEEEEALVSLIKQQFKDQEGAPL